MGNPEQGNIKVTVSITAVDVESDQVYGAASVVYENMNYRQMVEAQTIVTTALLNEGRSRAGLEPLVVREPVIISTIDNILV
jgi:hypothetical protein